MKKFKSLSKYFKNMFYDFSKRAKIVFVLSCLAYSVCSALPKVNSPDTIQAQSKMAFSIAGDVWLPLGDFAKYQGKGFGIEGLLILPSKLPYIHFTIGTNIDYKLGKTYTKTSSGPGWSQTITTTSRGDVLGSIIAGPMIGREKGIYFLPAISMSYYAGICLGFDFGGGLLLPSSKSNNKLNIGAKYSLLNLVGAEGESTIHGIRIFVGLVF